MRRRSERRSRNRRRCATLLGAGLLIGTPTATNAQIAAQALEYEVGPIKVLQRPTPGREIVAVRLYILGGSQMVPAGRDGVEALLFESLAVDSRLQLAEAGGDALVQAGHDWTLTGFQSRRADFEASWAAWSAPLQTLRPSPAAVGRARATLTSAARRRLTRPTSRVARLAWASTFEDHVYAREPLGTVESLRRLGRPELADYVDQALTGSRLLVVVVGDIERETIESLVASTFGDLPPGAYEWGPPPPATKRPNGWRTQDADLSTNFIQGVILGPAPGHEDYFAFEVATNLLSSQLHYVLRLEQSLTYTASAQLELRAIPTATVHISSANPSRVYSALIEQLEWLQSLSEVPRYILNDYLDQFVLTEIAQGMTASGQAAALAQAHLYRGDYRLADAYLEGIRQVRPNEIRRVALEYMRDIQLAYLGRRALMEGHW